MPLGALATLGWLTRHSGCASTSTCCPKARQPFNIPQSVTLTRGQEHDAKGVALFPKEVQRVYATLAFEASRMQGHWLICLSRYQRNDI